MYICFIRVQKTLHHNTNLHWNKEIYNVKGKQIIKEQENFVRNTKQCRKGYRHSQFIIRIFSRKNNKQN